jgi:hypothetical protein
MAAAALAMAVPPMPTKWTDLICEENIAGEIKSEKFQIPSTKLSSKPQASGPGASGWVLADRSFA